MFAISPRFTNRVTGSSSGWTNLGGALLGNIAPAVLERRAPGTESPGTRHQSASWVRPHAAPTRDA
jgi:hypothetical protein